MRAELRFAWLPQGAKKGLFNFGQPASPSKPVVKKGAKPLSPGSNYPCAHLPGFSSLRAGGLGGCVSMYGVSLMCQLLGTTLTTRRPLHRTTKNIQIQGNGFGTFLQKFQTVRRPPPPPHTSCLGLVPRRYVHPLPPTPCLVARPLPISLACVHLDVPGSG